MTSLATFGSLPSTNDPDKAFRNLDDEAQYIYLLLDSPMAETLFCKQYLNLELEPFQDLSMKFIRGRFHSEEEIWKFITDRDLDWLFNTGSIKHGAFDGISPYYFQKPNVLILWPAAHGKTTIVMWAIPVMDLCDNPNIRLQLIGKNNDEAYSFSTNIRQTLVSPKLTADFGQFKPNDKGIPWSDQAFSIAQRQWIDVRQNAEFYGTHSHAELGKRCDRVLIDDVETPDTARTPDQRDKLLEWTRIGPLTAAKPMWSKDGHGEVNIPKRLKWSNTCTYWGSAIVGTIFHPIAFYAMVQKDPTFTCVRFDCYKDKKLTVPLSENFMSAEELDRERKSLGYVAFNKRYRNLAYEESEMAFREIWVRGGEDTIAGESIFFPGCLDESLSYEYQAPNIEYFLGFDPSSGSKTRFSAFSAYTVLGFDKNDEKRRVYLVDWLKIQDNFDRMLDHLLEGNDQYGIPGFYRKYHYRYGTVEKNAFGRWLIENERTKPYIARGVIQPHYTGTNKSDPEAGVFSMGEMVQNGRLRLPYASPSDQERTEKFVQELLLYPKNTGDVVMSFWLANKPIRTLNSQYKSWFTKGGHGRIYKVPKE